LEKKSAKRMLLHGGVKVGDRGSQRGGASKDSLSKKGSLGKKKIDFKRGVRRAQPELMGGDL